MKAKKKLASALSVIKRAEERLESQEKTHNKLKEEFFKEWDKWGLKPKDKG